MIITIIGAVDDDNGCHYDGHCQPPFLIIMVILLSKVPAVNRADSC